ncbi:MAG: flagellar FliJ family protein [Geminicoccaceae bacterium]
MKIEDIKNLWLIAQHAADIAAQDVSFADTQRAVAEHVLADCKQGVAKEAHRAQSVGILGSLTIWYRAAACRIHDLGLEVAERAAQAASARESLHAAMIEMKRVETIAAEFEGARRAEAARKAQQELDEVALRRWRA